MNTGHPKILSVLSIALFYLIFLQSANGEEEIGSPLRIAQCRTHCIHRFSSRTESRKSCFQDSDCFMCWENCQLLQANFDVWGGICSEPEICFPGCQEACQFHRDISPVQQSVPVIQTRGEEVIFVKNHTAYWPRPSKRRNDVSDSPLIYVVMRRLPGKMWRQITQTLEISSRVPDDLSSGATLRVLVVDREGLLTIYSPVASESTLRSANDIARSSGRHGISGLYAPKPGKFKKSPHSADSNQQTVPFTDTISTTERSFWNLREVSLIHQKVLVIAEVAWDPVITRDVKGQEGNNSVSEEVATSGRQQAQQSPVYYVTWEVDGGGLKGNLFTDSTCVTLSLWPDTIYHIQVELVDHTVSSGRPQQSEDFILDTHRAVAVELDTPSSNLDTGNSDEDTFSGQTVQHRRLERSFLQYDQVTVAVGAAFLLFVLLLALLIYATCRHSDTFNYPRRHDIGIFSLNLSSGKKGVDYSSFPTEFAPILTLVSENASSGQAGYEAERPAKAGHKFADSVSNESALKVYKPIERFAKLHQKFLFHSRKNPSLSSHSTFNV